jgi:inner membrane protein involved in colicin E2 resistance
MLNLLGINSNGPIKALLGAVLIVIGVTQNALLLLGAGVLLVGATAVMAAARRL